MSVTSGPEGLVDSTDLDARFHLRIEPSGDEPIEVRARMRFPQLAVPPIGSRIAVIYDPDDPSQLMWDDSGAGIATMVGAEGLGDVINLALAGASPEDLLRAAEGVQGVRIVTRTGAQGNAFDSGGLAADLERLAALHRAGALDDAEFAAAKARLLDDQPGSA